MRLADVNVEEGDAIAVAIFQLFDGPKLGPIRPSGEAAEDQDQRTVGPVVVEGEYLAVGRA